MTTLVLSDLERDEAIAESLSKLRALAALVVAVKAVRTPTPSGLKPVADIGERKNG